MAKTKQEVEEYNYFSCPECDKHEVTKIKPSEFKKHLVDIHNIKSNDGKRRFLKHIDASDWFSWLYEWKIEGKIFHQHVKFKRHSRFGE